MREREEDARATWQSSAGFRDKRKSAVIRTHLFHLDALAAALFRLIPPSFCFPFSLATLLFCSPAAGLCCQCTRTLERRAKCAYQEKACSPGERQREKGTLTKKSSRDFKSHRFSTSMVRLRSASTQIPFRKGTDCQRTHPNRWRRSRRREDLH